MGDMRWTEEQRQVINLRRCNILVSAAAGSGKTAVLVARIMARLTDQDNPMNIDEFLIVTFTRAAAAEMRGRIGKAIEKAVAENPDNSHLREQMLRLHNAQISTIHSFCSYVIQNYFHRTDINPAYRLGSEAEIRLLQGDVMERVLERQYEEVTESFMDLADSYLFDKRDDSLGDIVLQLYQFLMGFAYPDQWLDEVEKSLQMDSYDMFQDSRICKELWRYSNQVLNFALKSCQRMLSLCNREDGPATYRENIEEDLAVVTHIAQTETLEERYKAFTHLEFRALSRKKAGENVDPAVKEMVKNLRDHLKKMLGKLKDTFFFQPWSAHFEDYHQMTPKLLEIIRITKEFREEFAKEKKERGLADFNDLEQYAIEILCKDGVRTEAAKELSEQFGEIMIDEYQDSNEVQETILRSVSSEAEGSFNLFRVGDVKQSIYRFRLANPGLFMEKMDQYSEIEGPERLVCLNKNFRSREVVIRYVNAVFESLMHKDLGGVEYDKAARLNCGADYPEQEGTSDSVEILVGEGTDSDHEREATMIGEKIQELVNKDRGMLVRDGESYRRASYGDVVILARSTVNYLDVIEKRLTAMGIPTSMEHKTGFYDTFEISTMVNMFRILDNPRQDIPLVATLRSPMFAFTDYELAAIKGEKEGRDYYDYLIEYEGEEQLQEKTKHFLESLQKMRNHLYYAKVIDLVYEIYEETGIRDYIQTMEDSQRRIANLDLLEKEAENYDATSYHGMSQFVRFLEKIRDNEMDSGEANLFGEGENVVRLMTIHKSKGLEFPICFVAGCHRRLKGNGKAGFLAIHNQLGIGAQAIYNVNRIRKHTVMEQLINTCNQQEEMGEEFRVLYVAMTRAKEKLILTGIVDKIDKKREKWLATDDSFIERLENNSYFDCFMPQTLKNESLLPVTVEWMYQEEEEAAEAKEQLLLQLNRQNFDRFDTDRIYHDNIDKYYTFLEQYEYPYAENEIPVKVSVSDLKKQSFDESESKEFFVMTEADVEEAPVPDFISGKREKATPNQGAAYGTIMHQAMATLDFTKVTTKELLPQLVKELADVGKINPGDEKIVNTQSLWAFFQSNLGKRMTAAMAREELIREQPFVLGVPARDILPEDSEEMVLVQGIIDGFFYENDEIILMDYKTDRCEEGKEQHLIDRYHIQLEFYKRALESITGKTVRETWIYSFSLHKAIMLPQ